MIAAKTDISIAVIKLSQFTNAPASIHFEAVDGLFRYLLHEIALNLLNVPILTLLSMLNPYILLKCTW
jgi:hypothetical protein